MAKYTLDIYERREDGREYLKFTRAKELLNEQAALEWARGKFADFDDERAPLTRFVLYEGEAGQTLDRRHLRLIIDEPRRP